MNKKVLVTGGAGFIGTNLIEYLSKKGGVRIVAFDKLPINNNSDAVTYVRGDILIQEDLVNVFRGHGPFETVYHLAACMPDKSVPNDVLWKTNVIGAAQIASVAANHKVKSFVFTSTNVMYGIPVELPVTEETPVRPLEIYGRSKVEAEGELAKFKGRMNIQMFRCPVVSGVGRLGLQAILFEFISENKNVYVLGDGANKYQFIDVLDLCDALEKSSHARGFDAYVIGADEILTLKEVYQKIIGYAASHSKIISLPRGPALFILSVFEKLNISPLGVYQYTMIGRSLYADTSKIKRKLNWHPKKTNADTFLENYKWYKAHKQTFVEVGSGSVSSNKSLPKMGIFKLLKTIS